MATLVSQLTWILGDFGSPRFLPLVTKRELMNPVPPKQLNGWNGIPLLERVAIIRGVVFFVLV